MWRCVHIINSVDALRWVNSMCSSAGVQEITHGVIDQESDTADRAAAKELGTSNVSTTTMTTQVNSDR